MKKVIISVASVLLMTVLVSSTAWAGGGIKISGASWSLGSLIVNGTVTGLGKTDVTMVLDAAGIPAVVCTNGGENDVPGQSSPKVFAEGSQDLSGNDPLRKNGKSLFGVETVDPESISWDEAGCPNSNWTARILAIYWTEAHISVYNTVTGALLLTQNYACTTTDTTVSCVLTH